MAMSCSGPSFCIVVGGLEEAGGTVPAYVEMTGAGWQAPVAIGPDATGGAQLAEISCASPTDCVAATAPAGGAGNQTIDTARFDGTTWQSLGSPPGLAELLGTIGADSMAIVQLTCEPSGSCLLVAADNSGSGAVVSAQLNGNSWSALPAFPGVSASTGYGLEGLSCAAAGDCYEVGRLFTSTAESSAECGGASAASQAAGGAGGCGSMSTAAPVVVHWDGSAWSVGDPPPAPGSTSPVTASATAKSTLDFLPGVSCAAGGPCYVLDLALRSQAVDELSGGTWSAAYSPAWPPQLAAVSCSSAAFCVVSGSPGYHQDDTQPYSVLAGGQWSTGTVDLPSSEYDAVLGDLSCPEDGTCYQLYATDTQHPYAAGTSYVLELQTSAGS
jgi:hypothetical protein